MNKERIIWVVFTILFFFQVGAQPDDSADFRWGNGYYYNLNVGESIFFNGIGMTLLGVENHYNQLKVGEDTLWLKVARRSLPKELRGVRVFVADNKMVKALASNQLVHGLLTKDALICLSDSRIPLLDPSKYTFPVSFNDGFDWGAEEDSYIFSYYRVAENREPESYHSYPGIGIDLHDARGLQKHWLATVENSRVAWVETMPPEIWGNKACVLLESESQPGIYYIYSGLFIKNILVKKGQKLLTGEPIGTAWGDAAWGHLHFSVIQSATEPTMQDCSNNAVNGFPQLFGLYFHESENMMRFFTRGRITFGFPRHLSGNRINAQAFENYSGKGWLLGKWNPADKVEWVNRGSEGNVRLQKVMFRGTPAQCRNPEDYFEYRITVRNGIYRIRAKVGDMYLPSWQKIEFNGNPAATKSLNTGETDWTGEQVVKVQNGTLNVRIYTDNENNLVAGLSEIVFQRAY